MEPSEETSKERFSVTLTDPTAIAELHRRMSAADRRREPLASEILTASLLNRPTQADTVNDAITRIEGQLGTILNRLSAPPKEPTSPTASQPLPSKSPTTTIVERALDWNTSWAGCRAYAACTASVAGVAAFAHYLSS